MADLKREKIVATKSPSALAERQRVYAALHMWDDEDTQVSAPMPMSELVNGPVNAAPKRRKPQRPQ